MSLQFSILKVLAGQPNGRAAVPDLNRYITLLSVPEWTTRMKRLSFLAPGLDIFGSSYVLRDDAGWQLTEAGYDFLAALDEIPAGATPAEGITPPEVIVIVQAPARQSPALSLRLVIDNPRGRRRPRGSRAIRFAVA